MLLIAIMVFTGVAYNLAKPVQTDAATNNVINFQARLENSAGAIVPDGTYNVEFKIYEGGTTSGGGTLKWTEDYLNSASQGVTVSNGYLTANLGSITSLATAGIDWNQQLYLTMNIGGTGGSASWDGEMGPRLLITAVPYAFRAGTLADPAGSGSTLTWASQSSARSILLPNEGGTLCIQSSSSCGFLIGSASSYIQNGTSPQTAGFNVTGTGTIGTLDVTGVTTLGSLGTADTSSTLCLNSSSQVASCLSSGSGVTTVGTIDSQTKSANGAVISGSSIYLQSADASKPGLVTTGTQTFAGDKTFNGGLTVGQDVLVQGNQLSFGSGATLIANGTINSLELQGARFFFVGSTTSDPAYCSAINTDNYCRLQIRTDGLMEWGSGAGAVDTNLYRGGIGQLNTDDNLVVGGTYNTNTFTSSSLQFGASSAATIDSASGQNLQIASSASNKTIQIGNNTSTGATQTINLGYNASAGSLNTMLTNINIGTASNSNATTTIQAGYSNGSIQIGSLNNGATQTINIGTNTAAVQTVKVGTTYSTSATTIQAGSGGVTVKSTSATALQIQDASNTNYFTLKTSSGTGNGTFNLGNTASQAYIESTRASLAGIPFWSLQLGDNQGSTILLDGNDGINSWTTVNGGISLYAQGGALSLQGGSGGVSLKSGANITVGTSDTTGTLLVLDTKTSSGDPTGVNGGMYYNSNSGLFRCYQASAWTNCIGSGTSTSLQTAYNGGNTIAIPSAGASVQISAPSGQEGIQLSTTGGGNSPFLDWNNGTSAFGIRSDSNGLNFGTWDSALQNTFSNVFSVGTSQLLVDNSATLKVQNIDASGVGSTITRTNRTAAASATSYGTGSYTPSGTFTPGANHVLLAYVHFEPNNQTMASDGSDITISGGSLTWVPVTGKFQKTGSNWGNGFRVFYAVTPSTPPSNMQVTVDAGTFNINKYEVTVDDMSGVNTSNPIAGQVTGGRQSNSSNTWTATLSATPATSDWKILTGSIDQDNATHAWNAASGWTENSAPASLKPSPDATVMYQTGSSTTTLNYSLGSVQYSNADTAYGGFILKAASGSTLNIGTGSASSINIGNSTSQTNVTGSLLVKSGSSTAFQVQNSSGYLINVDASAGQTNFYGGTGAIATFNNGVDTSATGSAYLQFQSDRAEVGYDGTNSRAYLLAGTDKGIELTVNNATNALVLSPTGQATFQNGTDSTTAFQVQNTGGSSLLTGDTSNMKLNVTGSLNVASLAGATAPTVIGGSNASASSATSKTITTNSSTQQGDLVMITGYIEPANEQSGSATYGTLTLPSGVTLAPGFPINTDDASITTARTHRQYVWYYYATASGAQNLTFTDTANVYWGLASATIRGGPTAGNPLADPAVTNTSSSSASGITTTPAVSQNLGDVNTLSLWSYGDWGGANTSYPAGYTDVAHASNWPGQPAIGQHAYSAAGSTGTVNATRSNNDSGMTAALLSIRANNSTGIMNLTGSSGTTVGTVSGIGSVTLQNSTNTTNAFQVQNASGSSIFSIDTVATSDALGNSFLGAVNTPGYIFGTNTNDQSSSFVFNQNSSHGYNFEQYGGYGNDLLGWINGWHSGFHSTLEVSSNSNSSAYPTLEVNGYTGQSTPLILANNPSGDPVFTLSPSGDLTLNNPDDTLHQLLIGNNAAGGEFRIGDLTNGNSNEGLQGGYSLETELYSYHGLVLSGNRQTSGSPAFINNGTHDADVTIQGSGNSTYALQVLNSSDAPLFSVNTDYSYVGIQGTGSNGGGGRLTFGDYNPTSDNAAWVGEWGSSDTDSLQLNGEQGIYLTSGSYTSPKVVTWSGYDSGRDAGVLQLGAGTSGGYLEFSNNNAFKWSIGMDSSNACGGTTASDTLYVYNNTLGGCQVQYLSNGTTTFKAGSSNSAYQFQNSGGTTVLDVDTTNNRVGINSTPSYTLDVSSSQASTYVARINNTNTGTNADGLLISLGVANASRTTGNYFVGFSTGSGTVAGKIQGGASAVAYTTTGADYAEYFLAADPNNKPQAGQIVSLASGTDKAVQKATQGSSPLVGVISDNPGFLGNGPLCAVNDNNCDTDYGQTNVIVGMTGQLPVTVSAENGAIAPGDPITAGMTGGVGVKATGSGQIVGYAMQSFSGSGTGTIKVYVNPGYYNDPSDSNNSYLQNGDNASLNNLDVTGAADFANLNVSGRTTLKDLVVTGSATIANLTVTGSATFSGDITVGGHIITAGHVPTAQVETGAGDDATCTITGNDTGGSITIKAGSANLADGAQCTLTFHDAFSQAPNPVISPRNKDSAQVQAFVDSAASKLVVEFAQPPAAGKTYVFNYFNAQ